MYKNGKKIDTMYPERRFYKASEQTATIVANRSRPSEDLYLVYTGRNQDTGKPIIKAHVNPLVMWIWIGVHMVLIGTLIALVPNMKPAKVTVKRESERAAEAERQERWEWVEIRVSGLQRPRAELTPIPGLVIPSKHFSPSGGICFCKGCSAQGDEVGNLIP